MISSSPADVLLPRVLCPSDPNSRPPSLVSSVSTSTASDSSRPVSFASIASSSCSSPRSTSSPTQDSLESAAFSGYSNIDYASQGAFPEARSKERTKQNERERDLRPRHTLLRLRQLSNPGNQEPPHSPRLHPPSIGPLGPGSPRLKRFSVDSVGSFESLPEGEEVSGFGGVEGHAYGFPSRGLTPEPRTPSLETFTFPSRPQSPAPGTAHPPSIPKHLSSLRSPSPPPRPRLRRTSPSPIQGYHGSAAALLSAGFAPPISPTLSSPSISARARPTSLSIQSQKTTSEPLLTPTNRHSLPSPLLAGSGVPTSPGIEIRFPDEEDRHVQFAPTPSQAPPDEPPFEEDQVRPRCVSLGYPAYHTQEPTIGEEAGSSPVKGRRLKRVQTLPELGETDRRRSKRDHIAKELMETERAYVHILAEIEQLYLQPLLEAVTTSQPPPMFSPYFDPPSTSPTTRTNFAYFPAPQNGPTSSASDPRRHSLGAALQSVSGKAPEIISRRAIMEIFSNFADILGLAREVLRRLEGQPTPPPSPVTSRGAPISAEPIEFPGVEKRTIRPTENIGSVFLPLTPFLKFYSLFVQNFPVSMGRIDKETRENERWKQFLQDVRKTAARSQRPSARNLAVLGLSAGLLNIVQRIPRYRLLLGDLLKYTEQDHPDYDALCKTYDMVEKVAAFLEVTIRQHENSMAILELQRSFLNLGFPLVAPGRTLLKTGRLRKLGIKGDIQQRSFFLFSDILVSASVVEASNGWGGPSGSGPTPTQYNFHRKLDLEEMTVVGVEEAAQDRVTSKHTIEVRSSENSFAVYASTAEEKQEWMSAIRKATEELIGSRRTLRTDETSGIGGPQLLRRPSASAKPRNPTRTFSEPFLPKATNPSDKSQEDNGQTNEKMTADQTSASMAEGQGADQTCTGLQTTSPPISPPRPIEGNVGELNLPVAENYSAPVWVPDNKADKCMRCGGWFTMWRRRHHCRLCGGVVCWACSTNSFIIPAMSASGRDRVARACDSCFTTTFPEAKMADPEEDGHGGGGGLVLEAGEGAPVSFGLYSLSQAAESSMSVFSVQEADGEPRHEISPSSEDCQDLLQQADGTGTREYKEPGRSDLAKGLNKAAKRQSVAGKKLSMVLGVSWPADA